MDDRERCEHRQSEIPRVRRHVLSMPRMRLQLLIFHSPNSCLSRVRLRRRLDRLQGASRSIGFVCGSVARVDLSALALVLVSFHPRTHARGTPRSVHLFCFDLFVSYRLVSTSTSRLHCVSTGSRRTSTSAPPSRRHRTTWFPRLLRPRLRVHAPVLPLLGEVLPSFSIAAVRKSRRRERAKRLQTSRESLRLHSLSSPYRPQPQPHRQ